MRAVVFQMAEEGSEPGSGELLNEKFIFIGSFEVLGELKAFSQDDDIHILKQNCDVPGFESFVVKWPHRDLDDPNFKWVEGPIVASLRNKENILFATICEEFPNIEIYVRALSLPYMQKHHVQPRQKVAVVIPVNTARELDFVDKVLKKEKYFFQILDSCPWYIK